MLLELFFFLMVIVVHFPQHYPACHTHKSFTGYETSYEISCLSHRQSRFSRHSRTPRSYSNYFRWYVCVNSTWAQRKLTWNLPFKNKQRARHTPSVKQRAQLRLSTCVFVGLLHGFMVDFSLEGSQPDILIHRFPLQRPSSFHKHSAVFGLPALYHQ